MVRYLTSSICAFLLTLRKIGLCKLSGRGSSSCEFYPPLSHGSYLTVALKSHRLPLHPQLSSVEAGVGCLASGGVNAMEQATPHGALCYWLARSSGHRLRVSVWVPFRHRCKCIICYCRSHGRSCLYIEHWLRRPCDLSRWSVRLPGWIILELKASVFNRMVCHFYSCHPLDWLIISKVHCHRGLVHAASDRYVRAEDRRWILHLQGQSVLPPRSCTAAERTILQWISYAAADFLNQSQAAGRFFFDVETVDKHWFFVNVVRKRKSHVLQLPSLRPVI